MRKTLWLQVAVALVAGCAPRQDPGIPIPKSANSAAAALNAADVAVGQQADTLSAIDAARGMVAENQSNAETVGYKAICCRVQDGRPQVSLNIAQGPLESTNRQLDLAISGPGFFRVKLPGEAGQDVGYTRNGNFFTNKNGEMVLGAGDGYRLQPPITVPSDSTELNITQDGVVTAMRSGQTEKQTLGQIWLYLIPDAEHLRRQGSIYFVTERNGEPIETKPTETAAGSLLQGFLEGSNVDLNREKLRADFLERWRAQLTK